MGSRVLGWIRPHFPEASDGILTSAGICEGFAGPALARACWYSPGSPGSWQGRWPWAASSTPSCVPTHDRQVAELAAERLQLDTDPDAELDELTGLYVSRGLSADLARQVAIELTAHDALAAHAEAEYGITSASRAAPLRDALAVSAAFAAGAVLPWLAIVLIPGPSRVSVTFVIVLAALALTGWVSARISQVHPTGSDDPHGEHRRPGDADHLSRRTPFLPVARALLHEQPCHAHRPERGDSSPVGERPHPFGI